MEAGKKRLAGDTAREANTDEVKGLSPYRHIVCANGNRFAQ